MNRQLRRALRAVSLTTALSVAATLVAPSARADDIPAFEIATDDTAAPVVDLADDGVATVLDTVDAAVRRCDPVVRTWRNIWYKPVPFTTANGSTWYTERGGAEAQLSCSATVRIQAWIFDESAPGFQRFRDDSGWLSSTGTRPSAVASVDVPYVGVDAPVLRPYGQVTIRVEVVRQLPTGRYSLIKNGCVEYYFLHQPAIGVTEPDPTRYDPVGSAECPSAAKTLAYDALDNVVVG